MTYSDEGLHAEQLDLLAAYADGALDADGRTEAEALIGRSERAREILAAAVRFRDGEGAGPTASATVVRLRRHRGWWAVPVGLAAAFAVLFIPGDEASLARDPVAALVTGSPVPAAFDGWAVSRGDGADVPVARLAARWLDARVLAAHGRHDAASAELARLHQEARGATGAEEVALRVQAIEPSEDGFSPDAVRGVDSSLRALDPAGAAVGTALEGLRLASVAGVTGAMDGFAADLEAERERAEALIGAAAVEDLLRAARPDGGSPDPAAVREAAERGLRALGR